MMACHEVEELLGAQRDGELSALDRHEVEAHLEGCEACRREARALDATVAELRVHYAGVMARAPRARGAGPRSEPRRRRRLPATLWKSLGGAAAVAAVILAIGVIPPRRLEAGAAEVLDRAAHRYLELEDVELWVLPESEALELLAKILKDGEAREKVKAIPPLRVLVKAPHYLLVQSPADLRGPWRAEEGLCGFDGERLWTYDEEQHLVEIHDGVRIDTEIAGGGAAVDLENLDAGFLSFLSWGFVEDLVSGEHQRDIVERTLPSDERAGRRVFDVDLRKKKREGEKYFEVRGRITVDPRRDFIESMVIDVNLGGLSLVTVTVDVARIDQGVAPRFFRHETHVPEGTPVVLRSESQDEDGAGGERGDGR